MASGGDKGFKQDLIVSTRFKNDLPPPPMPPKFLEIDTGGIDNYLTTSFASSMIRREDPNIDVDGEGGMPINMIGIPGYFLGDESAIMAPERPPILDPADQELLLSVDQIKSQNARNNVSFLRKTQYLSTTTNRSSDMFTNKSRPRKTADTKPAAPTDRDDKENVKRSVQKGFDLAHPESIPYAEAEVRSLPRTQAEREAWEKPRHPSGNDKLTVKDFYPVFPDFEAATDLGGTFMRLKFDKPPVPADHNRRDERMDVATFQAIPNEALMPEWKAKLKAHEEDPTNYDHPGPEPNIWVMATPVSNEHLPPVRKYLYEGHPDHDDPSLVQPILTESLSGQMRVPFERRRVFPNVAQTYPDQRRFFAVGLYDPESKDNRVPPSRIKAKQGKAAYFYPIAQNLRFKADRSKIANPAESIGDQQQLADLFMYRTRELDAREAYDRVELQRVNDRAFEKRAEELKQAAIAQEDAEKAEEAADAEQSQVDVEMQDGRNGDAVMENGRHDSDDDARENAAPAREELALDEDPMDDD